MLDFALDLSEYEVLYEEEHKVDEFEEQMQTARQFVKSLSPEEQLIVALYYYERLNMAEIADMFDAPESDILQMHCSIIAKLKSNMRERKLL